MNGVYIYFFKYYVKVIKKMGVNPFVKRQEFLGVLPAKAVWSYEVEEFQRSDIKILNTGKYLVDILNIVSTY